MAATLPPFTLPFALTGPGGDWTCRVAAGDCRIAAGRAADVDLTLTQRPATFVSASTGCRNPLLLLLTGQLRVRGFRQLGTFTRLFPTPKADTPFAAPPVDLPTTA